MLEAMLNMSGSSGSKGEWIEQSKLTASDGVTNEYFGTSVAISADGNTVAVSSIHDSIATDMGSVYIYIRSGTIWTEQAKLIPNDGAGSDLFGIAISLSGDGNIIVIGSYQDDDLGSNSGSTYIFTRSDAIWTQHTKLIASDGAANDKFGTSVSISTDGNTIIVGAPSDDVIKGSCYIFVNNVGTWIQQAKLIANDRLDYDYFGQSVSLSLNGDITIIGAWGTDVKGSTSGSAYVFVRSGTTWTEQAKLLASDGAVSDRFGYSVAISGDGNTAIVGAYGFSSTRGKAYIFINNQGSWFEEAILIAEDGLSNHNFSWSVSISADGNTVIISSYRDDDKGTNSGSTYVFTRSGSIWSQQIKLTASDGIANDYFGYSAAISANGYTIIIGSRLDDDKGVDSGSAYIYQLT